MECLTSYTLKSIQSDCAQGYPKRAFALNQRVLNGARRFGTTLSIVKVL